MINISIGMRNNYIFLLFVLINFKISSTDEIDSATQLKSISSANNYFAINLLRKLSDEETNVLFSPFCITTVFAMLYLGAKERTAEEIEHVFALPVTNATKTEIGVQFRLLLSQLSAIDSNGFELFSANRLVAQTRNPILEDYDQQLRQYFNSSLQMVDFLFRSDEAVREINEWVATTTRSKVDGLVKEPISPLSVLILINAIYFKVSSHCISMIIQ